MAGRIVVGVDGSPSSMQALEWALKYAAVAGASVEALCAWHYTTVPGSLDPMMGVNLEANAREIVRGITEGLDGHEPSLAAGTPRGHPVQVLVEASKDADLLVVGRRGHGGFAGLQLGSVSSQVSAYAHCPTVIVPTEA